jgi:hypothetical protein
VIRPGVIAKGGEEASIQSAIDMGFPMIDHNDPLVEQLLQAAYDHGMEEGSETEAGDLQEMLRAAGALLTPEQQQAFFQRPEITDLMEIYEYEDIDTTRIGELE